MKRHWPPIHRQRKMPIKDRIQAALVAAGGSMRFDQLADNLYPDPASHHAPSRGWPARMLSRAVCRTRQTQLRTTLARRRQLVRPHGVRAWRRGEGMTQLQPLSAPQLAERWGCSQGLIYKLIAPGRLQ